MGTVDFLTVLSEQMGGLYVIGELCWTRQQFHLAVSTGADMGDTFSVPLPVLRQHP